jgi:hypothetical protein
MNCKTEFDNDGAGLKLVATTAPSLTPSLHQTLSLDDWQRRARNVPTMDEAQQLRNELGRLQAQKNEEQVQFRRDDQKRLAGLDEELIRLYKQSVVGGYVEMKRMSPAMTTDDWRHLPGMFVTLPLNVVHTPLRASEMLRWESAANKCSVHSTQGNYLWFRDAAGMLLVTSERVLFVSQADKNRNQVWQSGLDEISNVELQTVQGSVVVVLHFTNQRPLGFEMGVNKWNLVIDGATHTLTMTPEDLVLMLKSLMTVSV